MNQTYLNAPATGIAWQTVADTDNSSIINRADIDVYVKLYAVSATKINDIRILPPILRTPAGKKGETLYSTFASRIKE